MPNSTRDFECKIVGLKYFSVDFELKDVISSEKIELRHNPDNKYDQNAIMVMIRGVQIGHIDRDSAKVISHNLSKSKSYKCKILDFSKDGYHIGILVSLEVEYKNIIPENFQDPKSPCIYRIYFNDSVIKNSYIGQSVELKKRILSHERDLNFGNHSNFLLQYAFNVHEDGVFGVEVVEISPLGLSPIDQQIWLLDKERLWIGYFRQRDESINRETAFLVETKESVEQFDLEININNEKAKLFRSTKNKERKNINNKLEDISIQIRKLSSEKSENMQFISKNTGVISFFSRSRLKKEELDILSNRNKIIDNEVLLLNSNREELEKQKKKIGVDIKNATSICMPYYLKRYVSEKDIARRQSVERYSRAKYRQKMLKSDLLEDNEIFDDFDELED